MLHENESLRQQNDILLQYLFVWVQIIDVDAAAGALAAAVALCVLVHSPLRGY